MPNPVETSSLDAQRLQRPATDARQRTVTVQRHDSLWAIAERHLGDGLRWKEILDLNVGRMLPDGTTITATDDTLPTGTVLLLPADAGHSTPVPATTPPPTFGTTGEASTITVQPGDNLWTISEGPTRHRPRPRAHRRRSRPVLGRGHRREPGPLHPAWEPQPHPPGSDHRPPRNGPCCARSHACDHARGRQRTDRGTGTRFSEPCAGTPGPARPTRRDARDAGDECRTHATGGASRCGGTPSEPDAGPRHGRRSFEHWRDRTHRHSRRRTVEHRPGRRTQAPPPPARARRRRRSRRAPEHATRHRTCASSTMPSSPERTKSASTTSTASSPGSPPPSPRPLPPDGPASSAIPPRASKSCSTTPTRAHQRDGRAPTTARSGTSKSRRTPTSSPTSCSARLHCS